ncbi:unnamed protein product, partial [Rhizoctonia solani]
MSFKTFCYSVCTLLVIIICNVAGRVSKYKEILSRYNSRFRTYLNGEKGLKPKGGYQVEPRSGRCPEAGTDEKTLERVSERAKLSAKKGRGSPNVARSPEGPSCRGKLEAALPILLQAVELDNAGSLEAVGAYKQVVKLFDDAIERFYQNIETDIYLEAVGAYKQVVKLFDDAIEVLNSRPWKPTRARVEARLRNL